MAKFDINELIPNTRNFKWREALWVREWESCVVPDDEQERNIISLGWRIQEIRDYFGQPVKITSWLRPKLYNQAIGGAESSKHLDAAAIDFKIRGISKDDIVDYLRLNLDELSIRMEDHSGSWTHIDLGLPGKSGRFFKP